MRPSDSDAARRLLELADQASRLPAYSSKNPHVFHEAKSELAAEIRKLARSLTSQRGLTYAELEARPRRAVMLGRTGRAFR